MLPIIVAMEMIKPCVQTVLWNEMEEKAFQVAQEYWKVLACPPRSLNRETMTMAGPMVQPPSGI